MIGIDIYKRLQWVSELWYNEEMDYQKIHDSIIDRARNRDVDGYTEKHHIVPKCMGGGNESENLVTLTAREHFVIHQLLAQIYPKHFGIVSGAVVMTADAHGHRVGNRLYGWLREKQSKEMRGKPMSKLCMKNARLARRGVPLTKEHRDNISNALKGKPVSSEMRKRISKTLTGRKLPEDQVEKMRGRKLSEDHCNNISKSLMGIKRDNAWTNDETSMMVKHGKNATIAELMVFLPNRSRSAIMTRRYRMGLTHKIWNAEEKKLMIEIGPIYNSRELIEFFPDRTAIAIKQYRTKLGVKSPRKGPKSKNEL